ncbi:MAG: AAA family ATPase [Thermomicrobiales bacterium]
MQQGDARLSNLRIVGRQHERRQLQECLDLAISGQGGLALVSGTAGIGKTTLVNDLINAARERNLLAVSGGSYALASMPPYGLWAEALRDYEPREGLPAAPPWIDELDPDEMLDSRRALHEDLRRFLAEVAATRPLLVALEDLHWSDPASLDALRYIVRQHHMPPVLIVGTMRNDEIAPNSPLYEMLPLLVRESGAVRIHLQSFSRVEIQSLVRSRYQFEPVDEAQLVDDLLERTAGNPFFVTEVLRLLEAEGLIEQEGPGWRLGDLGGILVPPLVRQVIEGWLSKLGDEDRHLLEIAAVIGQDLAPEIWESATNVNADRMAVAIDRALDAGLLIQHPETLRVSFTHALVRETLYQRLPLSKRQVLHREVAEIISDRRGVSPDTVASHYAQANDPRAIEWLIRSGQRALALYAARDAARALSRAHDLSVRFAERFPTGAYRMRASAFMMLGDFDPACRDFEIVLERARSRRSNARVADTDRSGPALGGTGLRSLGQLLSSRARSGTRYRGSFDDRPQPQPHRELVRQPGRSRAGAVSAPGSVGNTGERPRSTGHRRHAGLHWHGQLSQP